MFRLGGKRRWKSRLDVSLSPWVEGEADAVFKSMLKLFRGFDNKKPHFAFIA